MDKSKFNNIREIRKFAIYLGIFLLIIGLAQMFFGRPVFWYFYGAGLVVMVIGLFIPIIMKPIFILFSYIGFYLGMVNSIILLTLFFYFFVTPISFLLKFFGKDILHIKMEKEVASFWTPREKSGFEKKDFENQF